MIFLLSVKQYVTVRSFGREQGKIYHTFLHRQRKNKAKEGANRMYEKISIAGLSNEEWLRLRKQGIGGSDAGAICGVNPYSSQMKVEQSSRLMSTIPLAMK